MRAHPLQIVDRDSRRGMRHSPEPKRRAEVSKRAVPVINRLACHLQPDVLLWRYEDNGRDPGPPSAPRQNLRGRGQDKQQTVEHALAMHSNLPVDRAMQCAVAYPIPPFT